MRIIDPHIHFWDLKALRYPWLETRPANFLGDYSSLSKNHLPADFLADAGDVYVEKVVHIEAVAADPAVETKWLDGLSDAEENGGLPNAIVAAIDLSQSSARDLLALHASVSRVRGVRQILNVHREGLYNYVSQHYMDSHVWRDNFSLLREFGFSFDLQLYPSQMAQAAILADEHPETTFIINHTGMFVDRNSVDGYVAWRDGMRTLAQRPNVAVKISGLGMFDHRWTVESLRPYVLETIATFGCDRAMFASNFPVDRLFSTYAALWRAYLSIIESLSSDEKEALARKNAERIYRL